MLQPVLRRERVMLRSWREEDVAFVLSVASDPLIPLISEVPNDPDMDGALAFIAAQRDRIETGRGWAWATTSVAGDVLGYVGALWISEPAGRASIGYWTRNANRRGGFTTEAVTAAADWLLTDGGVARLEAFIEPWNVGSIRVAESAGFEKEGLMKSFAPLNGERRDAYLFARVV
jgi:ribosomal-protein-alanine N-acetyltransferase